MVVVVVVVVVVFVPITPSIFVLVIVCGGVWWGRGVCGREGW
jgi:hypothetical protein